MCSDSFVVNAKDDSEVQQESRALNTGAIARVFGGRVCGVRYVRADCARVCAVGYLCKMYACSELGMGACRDVCVCVCVCVCARTCGGVCREWVFACVCVCGGCML